MIERKKELRKALEAKGRRCTRQRSAIYQILCQSTSHPTAEQVYLEVKKHVPNVSLATVYKGLESLVACGLAQKLLHADGTACYDADCRPHYHLRCQKTGRLDDAPVAFDPDLLAALDEELPRRLAEEAGFKVTGYRLELLGEYDSDGSPPPS